MTKKAVRLKGMRKAFTLIELLVVVVIIAILAAMIVPAAIRSKDKAKESACLSQLKQIGAALQMYRSDYDDLMPHYLSDLYPTYITKAALFACPKDPKGGKYDGTDRLEGTRFIPSGVSYTWVPNWQTAISWGWWNPWPQRGMGKWGDSTPVVECNWHWANTFNEQWEQDKKKDLHGDIFLLTAGAGIYRWNVKAPLDEFEPK